MAEKILCEHCGFQVPPGNVGLHNCLRELFPDLICGKTEAIVQARWRPVLERLVKALKRSGRDCDQVWNFIHYGKSGDIYEEARKLLKETEV